MPREHGAWAVLLIPFATAVGVSGVFDVKMVFLLASVLCFYVARTSYLKEIVAAGSPRKPSGRGLRSVAPTGRARETHSSDAPVKGAATGIRWTVILLGGSALCAAPLLFIWKLWWLAAFGGVAGLLAFRKTERSIAMQLLAVAGLTLTAPAAWYAGTGHLGTRALLLWLLNALYFAGGVFYVKMHVAAAIRRKLIQSPVEKLRHGAAVLAYHLGLVVVLLALASSGVVSFWVSLAYAPVVLRAFVGVGQLEPALRIKRLGWTEVAYSLVYAAVLVATLRFG